MNKWHQPTGFLRKAQHFLSCSLFVSLCTSATVFALPEDADLPYEVTSGGPGEILLDEGIIVISGTENKPAVITQGSRILTGLEIRVEGEGENSKLTASGKPARFQQLLKAGEAPVYIKGLVLVLDQKQQILSIDGEGEFEKAGLKANNHHFDYDLQAGRISAPSSPNGEQFQMLIPNNTKE